MHIFSASELTSQVFARLKKIPGLDKRHFQLLPFTKRLDLSISSVQHGEQYVKHVMEIIDVRRPVSAAPALFCDRESSPPHSFSQVGFDRGWLGERFEHSWNFLGQDRAKFNQSTSMQPSIDQLWWSRTFTHLPPLHSHQASDQD